MSRTKYIPRSQRPDRKNLICPNGSGAYQGREDQFVWQYNTETKEWVAPARQQKYIEWVIQPKWERVPRTLREFADLHGFHPETVYRWKRDKRFKEALKKAAENVNYSTEHVQEVVNAVWKAAAEGDVKAAALFLQYVKELTPTQRIVIEDESLANKSQDELVEMLRNQLAELEGSDPAYRPS